MERTICTIARRMAMTLLLAVTVATAQAQNTLVSHIDCCKAGVCSIYIAGWVYDSDQNTKWDWWLGHGINVFAFVSTDPNETYQGYFPIPHDDMEYIVRTDVNEAYGLCNEHGFRTMISLNPYLYLFQDDEGDISERTFYVKIYLKANFGNGSQNFLRHSFAVTVRRNFGDGSEENPYIISDVGDWNDIIRAMNDDDMGGYYNGSHYRMDEYFDDTTPVTTMFGTAARPFTGTFDGNGKTLNVNLNGALHVAPFAYTNGATIHDLTVAGSINATQYAGGIVGHGGSSSLTLRNCVCSATIGGFQNYAGGLLGWCDNLTLNISDCLFKGAFSPANGGLYHPIACKNPAKTVTANVLTTHYVNTVAPSEDIGNNRIYGAKGCPVSATLVNGVWDNPVTAADGQTYYAYFTLSPAYLTADDVTEYTATPTWEEPQTDKEITGYAYQYKKASDANWSAETMVTTTSATLTGLSAVTDYQFRVRVRYSNDASAYSSVSFMTAKELPYEFGFENGLERWSSVDLETGGGIQSDVKRSGEKGFLFNTGATHPSQYLISPRFAGTTPLTVSFYYKDCVPGSGNRETFYVGYSTTTNDIDAFTWGNEVVAQNVPWKLYETIFPVGTRYVAVKYVSTNTAGLYLDDFYIAEHSEYPKPTNLTVSNLTEHRATLTWTAPAGATPTGYAYQYRKPSENTWSAETQVTSTTVTLSGLETNTSYQFRMKALNGSTASNYVATSFLTEAEPISIPYTDGFENGMGGWRMAYCEESTGIKATADALDGEHYFMFDDSKDEQYLISPRIDTDTPIKVTFYFKNFIGDVGANVKFAVGYTDATNIMMWLHYKQIINVGSQNKQWRKYTFYCPADTKYIVVTWMKGSHLYLDNFSFTKAAIVELADNADNIGIVYDDYDSEAQVTLRDRTFHRDGLWHSLCLPFDVNDFTGTPLEGATVKTLSSTAISNDTLTLNFSDDLTAIEAGKPYIVNWKDAAYLTLNSTEDWNAFADSVNNGNSYADKTIRLGADINISTMVGTAEHPFSGIFEGAGKKMTLSISNGGDGAAPFRYIRGATIRNVIAHGSVSGGNYTSGLVGIALSGTNTIHNCWVDATVTGGIHAGGILGNGTTSSTTIHDCKVCGSIIASHIGIIYGWGNAGGTHTIEHCVGSGSYNSGQSLDMMQTDGGTCTVTGCASNIGLVLINTEAPLYSAELGEMWRLNENGYLVLRLSISAYTRPNIFEPEFYDVTISDEEVPAETQYVDFIGCTSPVAFSSNASSMLYLDEDDKLHRPSRKESIGSCRAYFHIKDTTDIRAYVLNLGDKVLTDTIAYTVDDVNDEGQGGDVSGGGQETTDAIFGDVNGDGEVTIADVPVLASAVLSGSAAGEDLQTSTCDINGDGQVTLADVTLLVNIIKGTVPVSSIILSQSEIIMDFSNWVWDCNLYATILPAYASNKNLIWTSSNENVATVSQEGWVVGEYDIGESIITATAADGSGVSASCIVRLVNNDDPYADEDGDDDPLLDPYYDDDWYDDYDDDDDDD